MNTRLLLLALLPLLAHADTAVSPATLALHQRLLVLDSHLDTPLTLTRPGWNILERHDYRQDGSQVDLPRMREGGLDGGFFAVYTPQGPRTEEGRAYASAYGLATLTRIRDVIDRNPDSFALALTAADARRIAAQGKRVVFISMENADPLSSDPELLNTYYRQGLRMLGLVHFMNNDLADSATALPEWKGLSPKGRDLVQRANRLGILLDVSHASDAVFDQMLALSSAPLIASHSSSRAVNPHPRNLDDNRVRQLAAKGGVIQVNAYSDYLIPLTPNPDRNKAMAALGARFHNLAALSPEQVKALYQERDTLNQRFAQPKASLDVFMKHLLHLLEVAGPDHVGIGADWDGGGGVSGLDDVSQLPVITQRLLDAGYSEHQVANIWSGNLLRVLQAAQDQKRP
ncbi:membrane dipeptidase [Pseudomonas marginalis]|uniref:Membrane dipeptidase n=2 Tax=Pseudomonas TaxID=286 RepID=A0A9X9BSH0_PSEMA|nr:MULTISPECIES: dipeptidase [Pseudomonas]TKJ78600.1 membrane dipeptidase [Pseudomonas sp. CFBP13509]TWR58975.1 membrane dipeptidase [Pseudomonas marginalis]SEC52283.1 membrane dipeptidase [Pseudomonas marginalis]